MEAKLSWLEDPQIFRVNRLDAHSDHVWYESEAALQAQKPELLQSLNGFWQFAFSPRPADRPASFYEEGADLSSFGIIEVPGHIQLQGFGQIQYINTMYPWEGRSFLRPPHIDWEDDPVGSYVKRFDLAEKLWGKRVCISFQGAEEAIYVWLNGRFVGYAEDSFTPSDFDLTPYIREKDNRLCVEVYKRSSAAWIEDQDFFRFSGLFREVYLYAKPQVHVEDLWLRAGLQEDFATGTLHVGLRLSEREGDGSAFATGPKDLRRLGLCIACCLRDREGDVQWELQEPGAANSLCEPQEQGGENGQWELQEPGAANSLCEPQEQRAEECPWKADPSYGGLMLREMELPGVHLWSHEDPYLYTFELRLYDATGALIEAVPYKVGFRRMECREKLLLLNGQRLILNGVNRHEWNPRRGRAITEEDMLQDIEILKSNHINAVRTCHYPDQSLWYALCDEAGIYVMDEANLESHGSWQKRGKVEPSWNVPGSLPEWKDCVVDRAASMLERDKNHACVLFWSCGNESYAGEDILAMSRYFHGKDPSRPVHYEGVYHDRQFDAISDVESRMYATPREVREYLEQDPPKPFLLCEYMHGMGNSMGGMESYLRLQEEFPMYQGGFLWDFIDQALYRKGPEGTQGLGYGGDFLDRPTDYAFSANGLLFADRTEKPAMQEVRFWYRPREEREKFLALNAQNAEKALLERRKEADIPEPEQAGALTVIHGDVMLGVKGDGFSVLFSYQDAGPVSLVYDGVEWLYRAPTPTYWRAATENDKGNGFAVKSAMWMGADLYHQCTGCEVKEEANRVSVTYRFLTATALQTQVMVSYCVDNLGKILVRAHFAGAGELPQLPLFGLRFLTPESAEDVCWQGLSGETYPDRKRGAAFGVWKEKIRNAAYLVPQENGCHVDTQWLQVWKREKENGEERAGLEIVMADRPFAFSVLPCTSQELENAAHREELPVSRRSVLCILGAMRGVGGIDSWGADVEEAYQLPAGRDIDFSFYIRKPRAVGREKGMENREKL